MKSPSLDHLYVKLDRHIRLAESYTEIKGLSFIIRACRLKPRVYFHEKKSRNIILYREWFDEFGNTFNLVKKKIDIRYQDLSLRGKHVPCTDLYYGLSVDRIAKMSKLAYVFAAKDSDTYQDCYMIALLGIDNYLRTYMYLYDEWRQVSPLRLGLNNLKLLAKRRDLKYFCELEKADNSIMPCVSGRTWLSFMPASYHFRDLIGKDHDKLVSIFGKV